MSPRKKLRVCNEDGCPELSYSARCDEHTKEREASLRNPALMAVYASPRWQGVRRAVLRRDRVCTSCHGTLSRDVDHVISLNDGGAPYDLNNLVGLCRSCHSKKTAKET